jgi:antitoxin (DNA-binding transcriptional repressor) of toxin-antitoxin stability system
MDDASHELTAREREALLDAARWYARHRAHDIVDEVTDGSAYAVAERERYLALISALRKSGVRIAVPDELQPRQNAAA